MFGEDIQGLRMSSLQICESEVSLRLSDTNSQAVLCLATSYGHENNPLPRLEYAMINPDIAITIGNDPKPSQFLGLAYNQLGEAHLLNDRWEDAAKAFRDSINVYNEWDEVKHRGYRPESPWGSLATVLAEMGSNEEAAEILLENIRYREKVFGPADTDSIKYV
jgi:tetratricopeptide (TPR) repeat protein